MGWGQTEKRIFLGSHGKKLLFLKSYEHGTFKISIAWKEPWLLNMSREL